MVNHSASYERGEGIKIIASVLLPSRGRPDGLIKAINSLWRQSSNLHQIEFIVRLDNDDEGSLFRQKEFREFPNVTILVGLRIPVTDMLPEMAALAKGRWLIAFNDDAWISGQDWDAQLLRYPTSGVILQPEIYQLNESEYQRSEMTGFPFFPNGCWKEFGFPDFLPAPCDHSAYLLATTHGWKVEFLKGVTIHHDRKADATLPRA